MLPFSRGLVIVTLLSSYLVGAKAMSVTQKQVDAFCDNPSLASWPVLTRGRVRPLEVVGHEMMYLLRDKKGTVGDLSAREAYCRLSHISFLGEGAYRQLAQRIQSKVHTEEVRDVLQLKEQQKKISMPELMNYRRDLTFVVAKHKLQTPEKKEANKLLNKIQWWNALTTGSDWTFPQINPGQKSQNSHQATWISLRELRREEGQGEMTQSGWFSFIESLELMIKGYESYGSDVGNHRVELFFHKLRPFQWSMLAVALALIFYFLRPHSLWPSLFTLLAVMTQIVGISFRIYISGRAPITNMYETVLFSGLGGLILALILATAKKNLFFLLPGLIYNLLCLFMITFAHSMLDPSISPLVPVLRDNFWLSTHVTTVILSYGALALSWVMANIILLKLKLGKMDREGFSKGVEQIYSLIKWGVVLLGGGIILGGVWADYSWGRFWGWDPKETWSLIVFLIYMAILHGRYTQWIRPRRFVPLVALAFLSVMMAWFGVNYILAAGLHSYGFSEGGALFLMSFFTIQIIFSLWSWPGAHPTNPRPAHGAK